MDWTIGFHLGGQWRTPRVENNSLDHKACGGRVSWDDWLGNIPWAEASMAWLRSSKEASLRTVGEEGGGNQNITEQPLAFTACRPMEGLRT